MGTRDLGTEWHQAQLGPVDAEIARLAAVCDLRILDPGVIERVISGDDSVCGRRAADAFGKLRTLVSMHYALTNDSIRSLGPEESAKILDAIRERLHGRYDLGGS